MKDITFVDLEVTLNTCRVVDIGAVRSDRTPFHENSFDNLLLFLHQVPYIGGHNILKHEKEFCRIGQLRYPLPGRYLILAGIIY